MLINSFRTVQSIKAISATLQALACGYGPQPSQGPEAWRLYSLIVMKKLHCTNYCTLNFTENAHLIQHVPQSNVCVPTRWREADSLRVLGYSLCRMCVKQNSKA